MNYNWDIRLYITRYLPSVLRTTQRVAWLFSLMKPVKDLHDSFLSWMSEKREEASYTGQTIVVEYILNKRYPDADGLIYIDNVFANREKTYIHDISESETLHTFMTSLRVRILCMYMT